MIALESCSFHSDLSDAHEHMQNMLCGVGAALQALLGTKLILVSRLSPWCKIFQWKPRDVIVSAYAFIRSLHDKYTLVWWLGHAWYSFSNALLFTCLDFIIQFSVKPDNHNLHKNFKWNWSFCAALAFRCISVTAWKYSNILLEHV